MKPTYDPKAPEEPWQFMAVVAVVCAVFMFLWWVFAVHDVIEFHGRPTMPTLRQP